LREAEQHFQCYAGIVAVQNTMDLIAARSHLRCKSHRGQTEFPHPSLCLNGKNLLDRTCVDFIQLAQLLKK
jgi:hypothetical protein